MSETLRAFAHGDDGTLQLGRDVAEIDPVDKPCDVTNHGGYNGSFVRGGDGDGDGD